MPILELDETEKLFEKVVKGETQSKIEIFGKARGKNFRAFLIDFKQVEFRGKTYRSPSGAARNICGYAVDGWHFWKYKDENGKVQKIDRLRKQFRKKYRYQ
jgi:hypothetical protein